MKETILLIKTLLSAGMKGIVKYIYIGDPILIPTSCLPALIINPLRTDVSKFDNTRDKHNHTINIALVIDAKQYLNATPDKMIGSDFLMTTMGGELSGALDTKTILSIIRKNLNLGTNRIILENTSVDYTVRKRTDDLITLEAVATIIVTHIINR
ncbi:MAG: hypothetical protein WCX46_03770 [Candidatus Paceibacterota bacterium]